jgi:murein tripeptide amidase MpaA
MLKKIFVSLTVLFTVLLCQAQLKSPEDFLGYKIGSRYTPHYQVVNYFKHVAETMPAMVMLQQYGETNEHRPLYLAFVSSPENMSNLENIRLNNMRLAHLAKDKMAPVENGPAIVWLSYNVHGNETSSSEAAMLTIFALTDPQNTSTKPWLKNTLVIIDPCLNPDGRDRYVNWFNTTVGKTYDPSANAREHREPWPGGRTNHYNFDLNRDWAWQTQVESRSRIAAYLNWMPYVHVDFHEQGANQPYYFAPAA